MANYQSLQAATQPAPQSMYRQSMMQQQERYGDMEGILTELERRYFTGHRFSDRELQELNSFSQQIRGRKFGIASNASGAGEGSLGAAVGGFINDAAFNLPEYAYKLAGKDIQKEWGVDTPGERDSWNKGTYGALALMAASGIGGLVRGGAKLATKGVGAIASRVGAKSVSEGTATTLKVLAAADDAALKTPGLLSRANAATYDKVWSNPYLAAGAGALYGGIGRDEYGDQELSIGGAAIGAATGGGIAKLMKWQKGMAPDAADDVAAAVSEGAPGGYPSGAVGRAFAPPSVAPAAASSVAPAAEASFRGFGPGIAKGAAPPIPVTPAGRSAITPPLDPFRGSGATDDAIKALPAYDDVMAGAPAAVAGVADDAARLPSFESMSFQSPVPTPAPVRYGFKPSANPVKAPPAAEAPPWDVPAATPKKAGKPTSSKPLTDQRRELISMAEEAGFEPKEASKIATKYANDVLNPKSPTTEAMLDETIAGLKSMDPAARAAKLGERAAPGALAASAAKAQNVNKLHNDVVGRGLYGKIPEETLAKVTKKFSNFSAERQKAILDELASLPPDARTPQRFVSIVNGNGKKAAQQASKASDPYQPAPVAEEFDPRYLGETPEFNEAAFIGAADPSSSYALR